MNFLGLSGDGGARGLCRHRQHLTAVNILQRLSSETGHHTSDAVLELTVFGGIYEGIEASLTLRTCTRVCGVYEGIDAAVDVHQHNAEIRIPRVTIYAVADQPEKIHDLVDRPACNESTAYNQGCHGCVTTGFVSGGTVCRHHLKINNESS